MKYFARIQALNSMAAEIHLETMKLDTSVPKPGTRAHSVLFGRIDHWQQSVEVAMRDIKSASHLNHMIHDKNRFGPGSYSAGQRLRSKEAELAEVRKAAFEVASALADLIDRYYAGPTGAQRGMEGLKSALKRLTNKEGSENFGFEQEEGRIQSEIRSLSEELPPTAPKTFNPSTVVDVFTLILACFVLLKAVRDRKDS